MEDIKERIITTASELLAEKMSTEALTIREITDTLNISVSTVNYHFGSKDTLMRMVVQRHIEGVIAQVPHALGTMEGLSAKEKLSAMIKLTADYLVAFPSISRLSILSDLESGYAQDNTFGTIKAYEPMLQEIVGDAECSTAGMILAFSMQGLFMRMDVLKDEGIIDFSDKSLRDKMIDNIIDIVC